MDTEARDQLCCNIINQYLFDNVWNEPASEYRINIHPQLVKTSSVSGSFQAIDSTIYLPTTDEPYFVWYMKYSDTNIGLNLDKRKWYDTATICNDFNTLIHAYIVNGVMLPKGSVYLRYNYAKSIIFIAVKKRAFNLYGNINLINKLYLTIYYDSDVPNDVKVLSLYVDSRNAIRDMQEKVERFIRLTGIQDDTQLTVFKNGIEITNGIVPITDYGVWYDYIVDKNIIGKVDIKIGNTSEDPVFLSTKDSVWKQLIHIPKEINPNNDVITHNTCDIFIRNEDNPTFGLYLHRVTSTGRTVSQVTHNDMGIPLFIIDAYRDYLNTQNVSIHIVLRKHDKDNVLIPNAEYIDLLYADIHSDEDIINILTGKGPDYLPFWKAENLESSNYVKMMFDTPEQFATTENITEYIDTFGYYNVVNLLCTRITDTIVTDGYTGSITYNLPLMFLGLDVLPIVYINGSMLLNKYYTYTSTPESNTCKITISRDIYIKQGDKISVIFNLTENNFTYKVQPTRSKLTYTLTYNNPAVYEVTSIDTVRGINNKSNIAYKLCQRLSNVYTLTTNSNGTTNITFNDAVIGKTFIIENSNASYIKTYHLSEYTDSGKTIAIPINTIVTETEDDTIPILGYKSLNVYLNRNYLVPGIDYFVNEINDAEGNLAVSELVIQTMDSFIEGEDDTLTVVYSVADTEDSSVGFSIQDKLYDETPINLVYNRLTTIHVDGKLERSAEYNKTYTSVPVGKYSEGSVFEIKTVVPKVIHDFLNRYNKSKDTNRIALLNRYFANKKPTDPDVLILENKHRIYSTFLNNFIQDILTGKIEVVYDPDINRMNSVIRPYLYLRSMDLVFKSNNDQRFLDYYPQYINYEIDTAIKPVIDLYVKTYMPKNLDPTMEVVYENE